MSKEKSLWARLARVKKDYDLELNRLENTAGEGTPDVEGFVEGAQIWIELKSCKRPVRPTTPIRPVKREKQGEWQTRRAAAGCRTGWILIQVGEAHKAKLYLIPGVHYAKITDTEDMLELLAVNGPNAAPLEVLLRAARGW